MHILINHSINFSSFHSGWPCSSYPVGSPAGCSAPSNITFPSAVSLPWAQPQGPALLPPESWLASGWAPNLPLFFCYWSRPPGPCFCLGAALILLPDTLVSPGKSALLCWTLGAQKSLRLEEMDRQSQNKENGHPPRAHLILQRWGLVFADFCFVTWAFGLLRD